MLTSRDIKIIQNIVQTSENRLTKEIEVLDNKLSSLSDQIVVYVNDIAEDHEKRIRKLEKIQSN